jgi:DNA-binding transcriptional LysR family regulator
MVALEDLDFDVILLKRSSQTCSGSNDANPEPLAEHSHGSPCICDGQGTTHASLDRDRNLMRSKSRRVLRPPAPRRAGDVGVPGGAATIERVGVGLVQWRPGLRPRREVGIGERPLADCHQSARRGLDIGTLRAMRDGVGLLQLPPDYVEDAMVAGELESVLADWMLARGDAFFLYYSCRRQMRAPLLVFLDFLRQNMKVSRARPGPTA